jgi:hypothetical protein
VGEEIVMTLKARLDRIRESFQKEAPQEVLDVFHRVTEDLEASGMMDRVVGVIRDARSDPDYTRRPEPDDTLEELKALS